MYIMFCNSKIDYIQTFYSKLLTTLYYIIVFYIIKKILMKSK